MKRSLMKLLTPKKKRAPRTMTMASTSSHINHQNTAADRTFIIILLTAIARCLYRIANP